MKFTICTVVAAWAVFAGADIPWQFTIVDHPAPVRATSAATSATGLNGFARTSAPTVAGDLSAFRSVRVATPGSNLRSDPLGIIFIIR